MRSDTSAVHGRGQDLLLLLLAFAGGLTSLGLEIAASRLLAPFFGTSTYIWGALIGLILLYLTIGYYVGGWLADRHPSATFLYRLTAVAGALVMVVPPISRPVLLFSAAAFDRLAAGAFLGALLAAILVFAPAVVLLGMVSPFVIRLRVREVSSSGTAAGAVYAISTAGSILGAFLPAFWLVPTFGTHATIYGLGLLMLLVSAAGLAGERGAGSLALLLACAVPLAGVLIPYGGIRPANAGRLLYESDSEYGYIQVVQDGPTRELYLNEGHAVHSVYDPASVLTGGYWDYMTLSPLFAQRHYTGQQPRSALVIGLAGGTVARQLARAYPGISIDGVEIDPRIIDVGRRYFDMNVPGLHAVAADGRYFLDHSARSYDLIVIDAYRQPYIPFHLTTREFFLSCRRHLSSNGVVAVNVGRAPGDYRLVDAITGTMGAVFVDVYQVDVAPPQLNTVVYAPQQPTQPAEVAANLSLSQDAYPDILRAVVAESRDGGRPVLVEPHLPIYTDDLAPVERLVDNIIFKVAAGR